MKVKTTNLKGIFNTILGHSFIVFLRSGYFFGHITQNEEGLLSSDADQFTRVGPEDLGKILKKVRIETKH